MSKSRPDFSGYASRYGVECTDGNVIEHGAFQHQDGDQVPFYWKHKRGESRAVLGHVKIEHRDEGPWVDIFLNNSDSGRNAREIIEHGDVNRLSIFADRLTSRGRKIVKGFIKEVSLVDHGANPGAYIEPVSFAHDGEEWSADIEMGGYIEHADDENNSDETVQDVLESLNEKQQIAVEHLMNAVIDELRPDKSSGGDKVQHGEGDYDMGSQGYNLYESQAKSKKTSSIEHSDNRPHLTKAQFNTVMSLAEKNKSFKAGMEEFLEHTDEGREFIEHAESDYGITNVEILFPEARVVGGKPQWITRDLGWVAPFLSATSKQPFTRIRSRSADLTHDEARAKGYIKGSLKKDQFFEIRDRKTDPTTVYKRQKLDRDDILDVTEFSIVAFLWEEMDFQIREELARAMLIGDKRDIDDPDRINPTKIRPIAYDDNFYTHKVALPANTTPHDFVREVIRNRRYYRGHSPKFYTTEGFLAELLLLENRRTGDFLYKDVDEIAKRLRVTEIITVEPMESHTDLFGVFVNPSDYTVGTDAGGHLTKFDDFDIDYNQYKYLIETRLSGCLTAHKTALVFNRNAGTQVQNVTEPAYNNTTKTITIPTQTGIDFTIDSTVVTDSVVIDDLTVVVALAKDGYYIRPGAVSSWTYDPEA